MVYKLCGCFRLSQGGAQSRFQSLVLATALMTLPMEPKLVEIPWLPAMFEKMKETQ